MGLLSFGPTSSTRVEQFSLFCGSSSPLRLQFILIFLLMEVSRGKKVQLVNLTSFSAYTDISHYEQGTS